MFFRFASGITCFCVRGLNSVRTCVGLVQNHVSNKKISDYINNNLYVEIDHFPRNYSRKKKLFTNVVSSREDSFGLHLVGFYYDSVTSPFLLWKNYLDILPRIVFNSCYRHALPLLVPNSSYCMCRYFIVCTPKNCRSIVSNKIKGIFYKDLVAFCSRIAVVPCTCLIRTKLLKLLITIKEVLN